jgi:prophage maintenance system killer protein
MSKYSKRQELIIANLLTSDMSTGALLESLATQSIEVSEDSLVRDINGLKEADLVESIGKGPARKHRLTIDGRLLAPLSQDSLNAFLSRSRDPIRYNHKWMTALVSSQLFSEQEKVELDNLQDKFHMFMTTASEVVKNRWYQKWLIEFAWKSSAIEGNTYDALETETLILDHIEAAGKTHSEAVMILNHQSAVRFVYEHHARFARPDVNLFEEVHALLTSNLGVTGGIRDVGVGISGSAYRPLASKEDLYNETEQVAAHLTSQDIWSRALAAILAISYMQPFEDGNKRTARVLANGFLYANDSAPLVLGNIDPTRYRRACLAFYELGNTSLMKEILRESWKRTVEELSE